MNDDIHVDFNAPLQQEDTLCTTRGCRANNPDICKYNGLPNICAYSTEDAICRHPSKAWKKQFEKLSMEQQNDIE